MNDAPEGNFDEAHIAGDSAEPDALRYWRIFFWAAAVFNLIYGLALMLSPEATIDARVIGLLVFSFGIVFFHVARDPTRFGPVLWAGVLCKTGVVSLLAMQVFDGPIQPVLAGGLIAEGIFALGFLIFLLTVVDRYEL